MEINLEDQCTIAGAMKGLARAQLKMRRAMRKRDPIEADKYLSACEKFIDVVREKFNKYIAARA